MSSDKPNIDSVIGQNQQKTSDLRNIIIITICFAVFYIFTAQRGPSWQDSGIHQIRAFKGQFDNHLGLALAHPLLIAIAQVLKSIVGVKNLATAMNMTSSVAMAIAVGNVYWLGRLAGAGVKAARLAAAMLAFAHTSWWLATITESYALVCMFLSYELIVLYKLTKAPSPAKFLLLAAVSGLGWSLHNFSLLPLPVYLAVGAVFICQKKLKWTHLPLAAAIWLIAGGLQTGLIIAHLLDGKSFAAVISSALFGNSWHNNVLGARLSTLAKSACYIMLNFPFISLTAVIAGLVFAFKTGFSTNSKNCNTLFFKAFIAITAIELLFAVRYEVPDMFMFLLPSYVPFSVAAAVGIDRLSCWKNGRFKKIIITLFAISVLLTPCLYAATAWQLNRLGKSVRPDRKIAYRNENYYWLWPAKRGDNSAAKLARQCLEALPAESVLAADNTIAPPLVYLQLSENLRRDCTVIWPETTTLPTSHLDASDWLKILKNKDLYAVKTSPSTLKKSLMDLAEPLGGELIVKIPNSAISVAAQSKQP